MWLITKRSTRVQVSEALVTTAFYIKVQKKTQLFSKLYPFEKHYKRKGRSTNSSPPPKYAPPNMGELMTAKAAYPVAEQTSTVNSEGKVRFRGATQ